MEHDFRTHLVNIQHPTCYREGTFIKESVIEKEEKTLPATLPKLDRSPPYPFMSWLPDIIRHYLPTGISLGEVTKKTTYLGHPFVYPAGSLIGKHIEAGKEWDSVLGVIVEELIPEGERVICEVGSNIEASVLHILATKPNARILAFEPAERFRSHLVRNVKLAGFTNVEIHSCMLGRDSGKGQLYVNSTTASGVRASYDGHILREAQLVEMATLDEILQGTQTSFIKIDTDGYEFEVLKGAQSTLNRYRPVLHFEIAAYLVSEPAANLAWLQSLGYKRFLCLAPWGGVIGLTHDPQQVVAWANENHYCDVVTCFDDSYSQSRVEHLAARLFAVPNPYQNGIRYNLRAIRRYLKAIFQVGSPR